MTPNDIIQMAREAGFSSAVGKHIALDDELKRFAELVAAHEREACAKVCETLLGPTATDFYGKPYAAAIRKRGQA